MFSDRCVLSVFQSVPPTIWYRLVAGLNAQLRLVRRGHLRVTLLPVLSWLETHANPALSMHGVWIDLAWFQATGFGYCQFGLVAYAFEEEALTSFEGSGGQLRDELPRYAVLIAPYFIVLLLLMVYW